MLEMQRNVQVVRRWWWLLLLATVVGGVAAFALTKLLVQQQYQGTAIIAVAPAPQAPNGLYVTDLQASADAQLIPTQATASVAARGVSGVSPTKLVDDIQSSASVEGELLFVNVKWPSVSLARSLANQVAAVFIQQERARLAFRYAAIHRSLLGQEGHLTHLLQGTTGSDQATNWLRAQYADAASKIYQEDADARTQATTQEQGLQIVQPASKIIAVGPRAPVNAVLGAALAFLVALVFAYVATDSYGSADEGRLRPVLTTVGD